jgi:hypothetical protein
VSKGSNLEIQSITWKGRRRREEGRNVERMACREGKKECGKEGRK